MLCALRRSAAGPRGLSRNASREVKLPTIEYFYTLLSPYTYLAGDRLERIAARHGAEIEYRPVDFAAVLPETGGQPVPKRHPFRQEYRLQELARLSERAGMAFNLHPAHWPVDATAASRAVIGAAALGADIGVLSRAFLRAVWAEERDISDPATIAAILSENGADPQAVVGQDEAARAAYAANTRLSAERGVFGAPFYVVDGERFWGQDRLDYLDWHLGGRGSDAARS